MVANTQAGQQQLIRLAFEVPKGFENVAWEDIKRFLPAASAIDGAAEYDNSVQVLSGLILLALPVGPTLDKCLTAYSEGSLWAVTRVLLSLHDGQDDVLPALATEICKELEAERRSLPSKRSRQIINPNLSKGKNSRYRRRVAPLDVDTTPSELAFLDRITGIADVQSESHKRLYEMWKAYRDKSYGTEEPASLLRSFAVRFERRDFQFPTLKSAKISFYLAEQYGAQIYEMTGTRRVRADLTSPEYEIITELLKHDGKWLFFSGLALPAPQCPKHRLNRLRGRTTMLPERAYCLCLMHPELSSLRRGSKALLFLDSCCGFGSIPLEVAAIAEREKKNIITFSADNELASLEMAATNFESSSMGVQAGLHGLDQALMWNAYGKGQSAGFREGIIDGVVTDLPWGIRELTPRAISALYPALLRFVGNAVIDGGYGVFLCQRDRVFLGAIQSNEKMWEVLEQQEVNVEGVQAYVFVIRRKLLPLCCEQPLKKGLVNNGSLCVAEKPSVARSIAGILSGGQYQTRNTNVGFIKNMDFSYQLRPGTGYVDFTVTAVAGHLTSSDFTDQHRKWQSCDPFVLFDAPIRIFTSLDNNMQGIERNLLNEARRADELMIWTDCDREGEHIGSEVANVCRKAKPNIRVTRARFSAIIAAQIHHAAKHTVPLDMNQARAVEARMDLDLRIGAALTRIQTMKLQRAFPGILENVISYGSCQFPTLGFVVERYNEVQNFVSEPFWFIHVALERDDFNVHFKWRRNHLFDHQAVLTLFEQCVLQPEATVVNVETKPASKWKPLPLTTVELQKHGSRLLRLPPKKVLEAAEALYHKGLVSYPRTETDQFNPKFNFHELIERQRQDGAWGQFATMLIDGGGYERPRNGRKNDKAHPPIHPVQHAGNLQGDEKRVYEYITRRYLAMCSKNATGAKTEVDIVIAEEGFRASGLIVHQRNYLEVFPYDKWEGMHIPAFQVNERFIPTVCEMKEGHTTAPSLLTEADLVSLMDKNGIGTDATIAEHISKIIDREYAMRQKQGGRDYLVPSTLGIGLVEGYNRIGFDKSLSKPHLRAETEQRMARICAGELSKADMLNQTLEEYKEVYMKTKQHFNTLIESVREFIEGNGAGPAAAVAHGGAVGQSGGGGHQGNNDEDDDNDDSDGGGGGRRQAARGGRGGGGGGRGGRGGGNTSAPTARQTAARAASAPAPMPRGALAPSGGRGGGAGAAARGRPFPKNDDNDENDDGSGAPLCGCQQASVERTVFKEGPNTGRKFWACPKPRDEGCGFFVWQDGDNNAGSAGGGGAGGYNSIKRTAANIVGGTNIATVPRCQCDLVAAARISSKEGANQGRTFYTCSKVSSTKCRFFEWAEEGTVPLTTNNYNNSSHASKRMKTAGGGVQAMGGGGDNGGGGGCFNCGGSDHWANACPQGKPERGNAGGGGYNGGGGSGGGGGECFNCGASDHWSNACPQPRNAGGAAGGNNAGGSSYGGNGGGGASGDCFICQQPGHWSRDCPSKGSGNTSNNYGQQSNYSGNKASGTSGGGNYTCFKCGEPGHLSTNCPGANDSGYGGGNSNGGSTYSKRSSGATKRGGNRSMTTRGRGGAASTSRKGKSTRGKGKKASAASPRYARDDDGDGGGYDGFPGDEEGGYDEY